MLALKHWFLDANPTHKECVGKVTGSKNTETCMGGRLVLLAVQTTYTKIVHRLRRSRVVVDFPSYRFPCLDLFPTSSHDFSKIFLPFYIFQWFCNDFPTFFHDVPTFSHDFPMIFPCFPMIFPRCSYVFPGFSQDFPTKSALRWPFRWNLLATSSWKVESTWPDKPTMEIDLKKTIVTP